MIDEEDTELILEGGELYNYLKLQGEAIKDVYSSSKAAEPTLSTENILDLNPMVVPNDILNIVTMVLKSDLLLEEDASYLYKKYSELLPQSESIIPYKLIMSGMIIGVSAYGCWKLNLRKLLCTSIMACNTVYLFYEISILFRILKQREKIKQVLLNLKDITTYIRKNIKVLQEEDSLIYSKEKVLQLRNDINTVNEYTLSRKKLEIFIICQKLILVFRKLISLSRNITLAVLKEHSHKSIDYNISYIAYYSDEQLGINKYGNDVDEETNVLPFIDILRNVYLVMQSETLREIGLCLCQFTKVEEILSLIDILNHYKSKTKEISLTLKSIYEVHFYPSYTPKKIKSVNNNARYIGNILNSISSSLNSLLIDSRNLENFIDESTNEIGLDISQHIGFKLLKMKREMAYLMQHIHTSAQQLMKKNNPFDHNICQLSSKSNVNIMKTECIVGASDFSISGHDEVFLGLVDNDTENVKNDDDITDYEKPAGIQILINELKSALANKREEFERRELKALKTPEDIETYQSCLSVSNEIAVVSKREGNSIKNNNSHASENSKNLKTENDSMPDLLGSNLKKEFSVKNTYDAPIFDKDLAIKASDFLKLWNKPTSDECFGDASDDDY